MFKAEKVPNGPCSTGLEQNVSCVLAYVFGIVFIFIETQNRFVRFCAAQSLFLWGAWVSVFIVLSILSAIPLFGFMFLLAKALYSLLCMGVIGFLAAQAYQGNKLILPYIGIYAEQWSKVDE